ncbi:hypothetical protein M271_34530 [Streptomyces rapamycinicus NRRL 5491]|nr:hypothetical protein M271_34530 [Streptomyces rapamycinicus NRRL 5491]
MAQCGVESVVRAVSGGVRPQRRGECLATCSVGLEGEEGQDFALAGCESAGDVLVVVTVVMDHLEIAEEVDRQCAVGRCDVTSRPGVAWFPLDKVSRVLPWRPSA